MAQTATTSSAPVKKITCYDVTASIFQREVTSKEGKTVTVYNVSLTRPYTDKDGKRQFTSNLRFADLLGGSKALEQAFVYLTAKKHHDADASSGE